MESNQKQICPTCGTRVKEGADRCLVCGSALGGKNESQVVQGSRMPEITLGLPAAIGLVILFLAIGAGIIYLALQQTGQVVEQTTTPHPLPNRHPPPDNHPSRAHGNAHAGSQPDPLYLHSLSGRFLPDHRRSL